MSLNLRGLEPENPGLQVHRSLPGGPAGKNARKARKEMEAQVHSAGDDAPAAQDIQPVPQFPTCPQNADSPPLTLTPTPGPVRDSAPAPLRTGTEAAEEAVKTPPLECPADCLTNNFKEPTRPTDLER